MFGWLRAAAACASARKRRRNDSSSASASCSTLTATRRLRRTSSARNTCADAPVPTGAINRYRPLRTRPIWSVERETTTDRGYPPPQRGWSTPDGGTRARHQLRRRRGAPSAAGSLGCGSAPRCSQTRGVEGPATPVEVPSALRVAAWIVSLEAILEAVIIARRDEL